MRKYKEQGYVLQVGDEIEVTNGVFRRIDVVTRVTKTLAICELPGQKQPVRYQRTYGFAFYALPYSRTNVQYNVLNKT